MNAQKEQLEALTEMRDLMNRSSRFLSLSGISGVCAGVFALLGAVAGWLYLGDIFWNFPMFDTMSGRGYISSYSAGENFYLFFLIDAGSVLVLSLLMGWFFSKRKAKKAGIPFWDGTASRALGNLMIPLAAGGVFCLLLFYHGIIGLIAPATLIFYGLALLNASKYTLNDIRYLGICQIVLGLMASFFIPQGLLFWTAGFGWLHIVYGAVMYFKYER
jgi:hypothetical protein